LQLLRVTPLKSFVHERIGNSFASQSARGLAHSKTLRVLVRSLNVQTPFPLPPGDGGGEGRSLAELHRYGLSSSPRYETTPFSRHSGRVHGSPRRCPATTCRVRCSSG